MVKIQFYQNGFIISGHANFDAYHKDIVCAGISSIIIGSLNWFNEDIIYLKQDDGFIELEINLNERTQIGLSLIKTQIESIYCNKAYQPFIEYKIINKRLKGGCNE